MTDQLQTPDEAPAEPTAPPTPAEVFRPAAEHSFSLASLMLVVTLISLICGLSAVAPGLGIVAAVIALPAFARTAIVLRHAAPAAAAGFASKLAAFGTSCCISVVVVIATGSLGFGACWVTGYPSAIVGGVLLSPLWPRGDRFAPMALSGIGVGILTGCAVAVFLAYRLLLRPMWFPIVKQELSRRERRFLLGALILTALGTSAVAIFFWSDF